MSKNRKALISIGRALPGMVSYSNNAAVNFSFDAREDEGRVFYGAQEKAVVRVYIKGEVFKSEQLLKGKEGDEWTKKLDGVGRCIPKNEPSLVVLFRDSNDILLVKYSPDSAPVKMKMVYASATESLKSILRDMFGDELDIEEFFASSIQDISSSSYQSGRDTEAPLTESEVAQREYEGMETGGSYSLLARLTATDSPVALPGLAKAGLPEKLFKQSTKEVDGQSLSSASEADEDDSYKSLGGDDFEDEVSETKSSSSKSVGRQSSFRKSISTLKSLSRRFSRLSSSSSKSSASTEKRKDTARSVSPEKTKSIKLKKSVRFQKPIVSDSESDNGDDNNENDSGLLNSLQRSASNVATKFSDWMSDTSEPPSPQPVLTKTLERPKPTSSFTLSSTKSSPRPKSLVKSSPRPKSITKFTPTSASTKTVPIKSTVTKAAHKSIEVIPKKVSEVRQRFNKPAPSSGTSYQRTGVKPNAATQAKQQYQRAASNRNRSPRSPQAKPAIDRTGVRPNAVNDARQRFQNAARTSAQQSNSRRASPNGRSSKNFAQLRERFNSNNNNNRSKSRNHLYKTDNPLNRS